MTPSYRVGLVGAGAVGLYYASFFKETNTSLSILTRFKEQYNNHPFVIESVLGNRVFNIDDIILYGDDVAPFDLIIVATKVLPSVPISNLIKPYLKADTLIFQIQNGIGIEDELCKFENPVIRGLAFICADRSSPHVVNHYDYGKLSWGIICGNKNDPCIQKFEQFLNQTSMNHVYDEDIQLLVWKKLLWNIPFNCLSVFYGGVDTNYLLSDEIVVEHVTHLMDEVIRVAQKLKICLTTSIKDAHLKNTRKMKPYFTSMCLDFKAGRPLELESILGNFIKIAIENNCDVPYSHNLYNNLVKNYG